ncbi:MAG: hypothetical protein LBU27_07230 [Candidatus Peribacteria bacterium]|jgi:hypothetical protein|nr:hypothetical protein [Candidatus Peribacteria bacterium]
MDTNLALQGEKGEIIIYQPDGALQKIEVKIVGETARLSQAKMVELFERNQSVISRHINNIFKE